MTLPNHPFTGASFFSSVRSFMDIDRGLFGGNDDDLQYVIMDAIFYRPEILIRPSSQSFTDAGRALSADVRVLVNGQIFGTSKWDYCFSDPCNVQWQGEIIDAGTTRTGNPASRPDHRFFGRENAIPIWRYHAGQGDPAGFSPTLHYAMGSLLPLIQGGTRFGNGNQGTPPNRTQIHSGATTHWMGFPASQGKTAVGIHRSSGCLFVICQQDGASTGMNIRTLITRLQTMGVDDAVLCDGSDSATLIVDRTVHVAPADYKNNSIPTGILFRLKDLPFQSGATFEVDVASTDPGFPSFFPIGTALTGMAGTISVRSGSPGGLELSLTSFGTGTTPHTDLGVANLLGVSSLPVTLTAASTDLTTGVPFSRLASGSESAIDLALQVIHTPGQHDRLTGILTVTKSTGTITGPVVVPI
jgi:hypothetical protein